MADSKITELTELTSVASTDVLAIVDDPSGSPITKKITKANLVTAIANSDITNATTTSGASKIPIADGSGKLDTWITDAAADGSTKGKAAFTAADFDAASGVISIDYTNGQKASTTQAGFLTEIATSAETTAGTDAARAVSPDGFAGSDYGIRLIQFPIFDVNTVTTTGNGAGDIYFRVPSQLNGYNLVYVAASVSTAATGTGTETIDIQIRNATQTADMLTTKLTIDEDETDSTTAATAAVIDTANDDVATGDQIFFDVDAIPTTTGGNGLSVTLGFQAP